MKEREWRIASERGRPLFKFRAFDPVADLDPDRQGRLASLFRDSLIYCASSRDLNDPWEGRTAFLVPDCDVESESAAPYIKSFCDLQPPERRDEAVRWLKEKGFHEVTRHMQDHFYRDNSRFSVFCLAGNATHPLLWGHYADGFRGYCLIFDHTVEPFASAAEVTYRTEYPVLDWGRWDELNTFKPALLTKADYWSCEDRTAREYVWPRPAVLQNWNTSPNVPGGA
jgi:hypothetical protein